MKRCNDSFFGYRNGKKIGRWRNGRDKTSELVEARGESDTRTILANTNQNVLYIYQKEIK